MEKLSDIIREGSRIGFIMNGRIYDVTDVRHDLQTAIIACGDEEEETTFDVIDQNFLLLEE